MNLTKLLVDVDPTLLIGGLALTTSLLAIFLTGRQVSLLSRQLRLDSLIKVSDANRAIVALGIENPALYKNLGDDVAILNSADSEQRKHYLQLWFNHMLVIWKAHDLGLLDRQEWLACKADMADFLQSRSLRAHWQEVHSFFPRGFQRFVSKVLSDCTLKESRSEKSNAEEKQQRRSQTRIIFPEKRPQNYGDYAAANGDAQVSQATPSAF